MIKALYLGDNEIVNSRDIEFIQYHDAMEIVVACINHECMNTSIVCIENIYDISIMKTLINIFVMRGKEIIIVERNQSIENIELYYDMKIANYHLYESDSLLRAIISRTYYLARPHIYKYREFEIDFLHRKIDNIYFAEREMNIIKMFIEAGKPLSVREILHALKPGLKHDGFYAHRKRINQKMNLIKKYKHHDTFTVYYINKIRIFI